MPINFTTKLVEQLYLAYLARPADPGGLASVSRALQASGVPLTLSGLLGSSNPAAHAITLNLAFSAEAAARFGSNLSPNQVVFNTYKNLLDRTPDAGGLAFWTAAVTTGRLLLSDLPLAIAAAAEFAPVDALTLQRKVEVATAFTNALDTPPEIAAYMGIAAADFAQRLLDNVNANTTTTNFQGVLDRNLLNLTSGSLLVTDANGNPLPTPVLDADPTNGVDIAAVPPPPPPPPPPAPAPNAAPVLAGSNPANTFVEKMPAVVINAGLAVSDADSSLLAGASVSISGGFSSGQDVLAYVNTAAITGTYSASAGVLTLSGSASPAAYQTALRSVTYSNSSSNPSTALRSISFSANDGNSSSAALTSTIAVTAVNDAPVIDLNTATGGLNNAGSFFIGATMPTPLAVNNTVTDVDSSSLTQVRVSFTAASNPDGAQEGLTVGGSLIALNFANAAVIANVSVGAATYAVSAAIAGGTSQLTFTSTDSGGLTPLANASALIASLAYSDSKATATTGDRVFTITVNDGAALSNTAAQTSTIAVGVASGTAGDDYLVGTTGNDSFSGLAGNDTITGNGGNDSIDGGPGNDTVVFRSSRSNYSITWDGTTAIVVANAASGEAGTSTITNVGTLVFSDRRVLLVDDNATGGEVFSTISAAAAAAASGNELLIGPGTYTEDISITSKPLILTGAGRTGAGATTINGQVTVSGTLDGLFSLSGAAIDATGKAYGVLAEAGSTAFAGSVALSNVTITNATTNGFAYIRAGTGAVPSLTDTVGNISISNSGFSGNSPSNTGNGGRGDIILFGYNQNLTLSSVDITPGASSRTGLQLRGLQWAGDVTTVGPFTSSGTLTLTAVTFHDGSYLAAPIQLFNSAGFAAASSIDVSFTNIAGAFNLVNVDGVGGTLRLTNVSGANASAVTLIETAIQGLATADTLVGSPGRDFLNGRGGIDTLTGGAGNDTFSLNLMGADNVTDFVPAADVLRLSKAVFTALTTATNMNLASAEFLSVAGGMATTAAQRVIYNSSNGQLFYDADGSGAGAAVQIATLIGVPNLAASDIAVAA